MVEKQSTLINQNISQQFDKIWGHKTVYTVKPNPPEACQQTWRHDGDDGTSVHLFIFWRANQSKSIMFVIS